jgi:hypothetical protein
MTPTGKKVNPKTVGSESEQIQQKRIEAERLKAEKKLMEDTLKSVLNQEFVQDDNADILRAENVELASAEWVNKTYLSNSYMIPYNDSKMMDMSSIIAIAVSMCGKKLVSRNAIITTMAIETGKSYIYKDGKPLNYSTTSSLSGFASVRDSGVPGKLTSASGYCQVIRTTGVPYLKIYASEKKKTGRAPKTGYARTQFGDGWSKTGNCDTRNIILHRDLTDITMANECTIASGILQDPYTGETIHFSSADSSAVQIDHIVALSDAWQKGAQQLTKEQRQQLANDPLELLAVDGPANQQKGDGDAATWLPKNKAFRCTYIERQVIVKQKYSLWVTDAEKTAMIDVLKSCTNS